MYPFALFKGSRAIQIVWGSHGDGLIGLFAVCDDSCKPFNESKTNRWDARQREKKQHTGCYDIYGFEESRGGFPREGPGPLFTSYSKSPPGCFTFV